MQIMRNTWYSSGTKLQDEDPVSFEKQSAVSRLKYNGKALATSYVIVDSTKLDL